MRLLKIPAVFFTTGLMLVVGCGSGTSDGEGGAGGHAGAASGGHAGAASGGTGGHAGGAGAAGPGGHSGASGGAAGAAGGAAGGTAGAIAGAGGGTAGAAAGAGGAAGASVGGAAGGSAAGAGGGAAGAGGGAAGAGGSAAGAGGSAAGAGGSAAGAGGSAAGAGGSAAGAGGGAAGAGGAVDPVAARGEYLVKNVLGCAGCHTPSGGAFLSGTDCFSKGTTGTDCLSSANLTNDATGLMNLSDQQIKDAFRQGIDPDEPTKYLFSNMPYYQFANVSDADASAIVAYLRTVPGVSHTVSAKTGSFQIQPSTPEWAPVDPAMLPAAGGASGPANGKYLATLVCVTCHTVNVTGSPLHIDATKAFQGGKGVNTTANGTAKTVQTSNLTPDATGLMTWNVSQIATAITTGKDRTGATICGMRALANMAQSDAIDIGTYLLGLPAVANPITMTCQ
jgi:hypothetical protein